MAEPEQKQQPSLAEQYDVAPAAEPAADGVSGPAAPAESRPPEAAPDERPRDPDTGRFVSPQTPPSGPQTHQHSPIVRRLARDLGWADDEIAQTDPAVLSNLVLQAREERWASQRADAVDRAVEGRKQAPSPPPEDDDLDPAEFGLAGTRNDWDPSLLKRFRQEQEKNKSLEERLARLEGHLQKQEALTARSRLERHFSENYPEVMGPEPALDAGPKDPSLLKRRALFGALGEMFPEAKGNYTQGQIDLGMEAVFGQKPKSRRQAAPAAGREPVLSHPDDEDAAARWREGALARPTHRAGAAEPKGYEKAVASVARAMRENGARDVPPPAISDEFPG